VTAVIDASALVAFCLNEEGLDREKLKGYLRNGVISIELIKAESANAILVAKRRAAIDEKAAKLALASVLGISGINVKMMPQEDELISDAFELSSSNSLAIYDLLYLSLAKKTGGVLLSKDASQVRLARKLGIEVENI
jgi:predicted nucleic acid-binding protein